MSSWFFAATVTGVACAMLAMAVLAAGWRRTIPEVAMLGTALLSISVLATAFGLSGTSVGVGPAEWAAVLALPVGVFAVLPVFVPTSNLASTIGRAWRMWVSVVSVSVTVLAFALGRTSSEVPTPAVIVLLGAGLGGAGILVRRQLLLFRVSERRAALVTAAAVTAVAISSAASMTTSPGTTLAWVLLVIENLGVFGAGAAIIVGYNTGSGVSDVLAPLLSREPLAALDVGLSPEVHAFVAALAEKDLVTRDHVVRSSALAMRSAIRAGLPARQIREVALGALLHDIGKLVMPSDIINKPGALTDEEFLTIKSHPEQGEKLLAGAPSLVGAARYVRWHHERVDGRGYPDGLEGDQISFEVGLVSVADAWDAMTHTRQYREGMSTEKAEAILRDGADTQWRRDAVECLLAEVRASGQVSLGSLHRLGETAASDPAGLALEDCACSDALPSAVGGMPSEEATSRTPQTMEHTPSKAEPTDGVSVLVSLGRADFSASVHRALAASGAVGQLISVRLVEHRSRTGSADETPLLVAAVQQLIAAALRSDDVTGRWNPSHFVISLPSASPASANEIARRIRVAASELATMSPALSDLRLDVVVLAVHRSEIVVLDALLDGLDPVITLDA